MGRPDRLALHANPEQKLAIAFGVNSLGFLCKLLGFEKQTDGEPKVAAPQGA
jgi:hypothetical protein